MPHYAFTPPRKETASEASSRVSNALTGAIDIYMQGKGKEEAQRKQEESLSTIQDPNSSNLQKAIAWGNINPKVQEQLIKQEKEERDMSLLSEILQRRNQENQPQITSPMQTQKLPVENSSQMGTFNQMTMQSPTGRVPNVNELREQLSAMIPITGATPPIVPRNNFQNQPQDDLQAKRNEVGKLQEDALLASFVNPTVGARLDSQANRLSREIEAEEKNRTKIEAANINAQAVLEEKNRKESQKYVDKILDSYQGSKTTSAVLGQMKNLAEKGNLTTPVMSTLINKVGIPLGVLDNPDSEEFDKLANTLTRDIQKFYGSRILASEFQNFLRQIPTLQNSPEGRKRIIENLEKTILPAKIEYDVYRQILKENNGVRPRDIREQVIDRMEPLLDEWSKEFKNNIEKTNPDKIPMGSLIVLTPEGRRVAVPKDRISEALSNGGKLE